MEAKASVTAAPAKIIELVEKFERDQDIYRSSQYNETELRTEFINPFFEALGWDVYHKQECRADKREVKEEDAVDVEGKIKNPDYSFRLFDKRKFFVEVKRPSINIESGVYPAYQIRRYAWSADLAISILTDFEEFSVYYCRTRPSKDDKSTKSRLLYFRYDQYAEKWPEIAALFSREAVLSGSLDKYVQSLPQKRGDKRVDAALLDDISEWREMLAKSIARHNPELETTSLNYAVQTIIDRIIFLRICEDRGIERYMRLKDLLSGERVYPRLCELFLQADERYNSGIFHFSKEPGRENPDTITPGLVIDDETLKSIIKRLYFPESPYEFSVLPAEILGQIYEQFLGKVIRLDEGHNALVEDKPEVKKAGGVKYTPAYIVEYIVQNTISPLLEGKTLQEAASLRVLDPACGSGSFLIVAYQHLLDWHKEWYIHNLVPLIVGGRTAEIKKLLPAAPASKSRKGRSPELPVYQSKGEEWKLTTAERKRILLNNIFGVDIDRQAVEVTKLSLLLKVLEGENEETISKQLKLFAERALPDLSRNIKCGNSLVGWDILKDNPGVSGEEIARINPFDWEKEFQEIMQVGGFDSIIGNPPYIRVQRIGDIESKYLFGHYETLASKTDLSQIFLEKSLKLIKDKGLSGFICTSQWLTTEYGKNMRRVLSEGKLHEFVDFGSLPVFQGANTYPGIFILSRVQEKVLTIKRIKELKDLNLKGIDEAKKELIPFDNLSQLPWNLSNFDLTKSLKARTVNWTSLRTFGQAYYSIITGMDVAFVVESEKVKILGLEYASLYPFSYRGNEINRYLEVMPKSFVIYPYVEGPDGNPKLIPEEDLKDNYPNIYNYLLTYKEKLRQRKDSRKLYAQGSDWYRHVRPGSFTHIHPRKLIIKGIDKKLTVGILAENIAFSGANCPGIILDKLARTSLLYILGLLNSKLVSYHLKIVCPPKLSGYTRFNANNINDIPIRTIDFSDPADVARHDRMVSLVEKMLALHKQLPEAHTPHEKVALERQIEATDGQIDALVYELYELTEEEIGIVEGT